MNAFSSPNSARADSGLAYLPIFLGIRGRVALLVGGGDATLAKLDLLRRAGARVRLVANDLHRAVSRRVANDGMVLWTGEPLQAHHFVDAVLAIDASGDESLNALSVRLARQAAVPINVVDRPALCDFIVPAILDRSPVVVAVSTGGLAPAIARLVRQRLETVIPAGFGRVAMLAASIRHLVQERLCGALRRTRFWDDLFDGPAADLAVAGHMDGAIAAAHTLLEQIAKSGHDAEALHVFDAGAGNPDLLTVRAARFIRMADVIIHEPAVGEAILELARRDAIKIEAQADCALDGWRTAGRVVGCARPGNLTVYLKAGA